MATEPDKIVYGGDMMIFVEGEPIAFSTDAKLSIKLATREISSKDSGNWVERKGSKLDWNASSSALYTLALTATTTTSIDALYTLMAARAPITVVFAVATGSPFAQTVDTSAYRFTGEALITALDLNAPDNDNATYSITLDGATGGLAMTTGA